MIFEEFKFNVAMSVAGEIAITFVASSAFIRKKKTNFTNMSEFENICKINCDNNSKKSNEICIDNLDIFFT